MNPLGIEVIFASRFSLSTINAAAIRGLAEDRLQQLAECFCNDSYWFDQKACSSPRLIVWVGDKTNCDLAKELFWTSVQREIARRSIQYPEVVGVNKLVTAFVSAGLGMADSVKDPTGSVSRIHLTSQASPDFRNLECGGGIFFETEIPELKSLPALLTERDQTLSYFGFERGEIRALALSLSSRAVDRIVPIGSALTFSSLWDGNDLLQTFSREIDVQ